jgi:hypothetical protein
MEVGMGREKMLEVNRIMRENPEARTAVAHFLRYAAERIRKSQHDPFTCRSEWEEIAEEYEARAGQLERGENLK